MEIINTAGNVENTGEIVVYEPDEITRLEVHMKDETVWLTQTQMSALFGRDRTVITKHIRNIFTEQELDEKSNVHFLHFANSDKPVKIFSLDVIISVGYRVKSAQGTRFRQWANKVIKEYLLKGYCINPRITAIERFPASFMFRLEYEEFLELVTICDRFKNLKHSSNMPHAFTEQGVAMLASVLRSPTAVSVSIRIMESFVKIRQFLMKNSYMFQKMNILERRLAETESKVGSIMKIIDNNPHIPQQGIFLDGQIYDTSLINQFNILTT